MPSILTFSGGSVSLDVHHGADWAARIIVQPEALAEEL
jgi:hypothetical protein